VRNPVRGEVLTGFTPDPIVLAGKGGKGVCMALSMHPLLDGKHHFFRRSRRWHGMTMVVRMAGLR
jgi:hypothetical protein